MKVSRKVKRRQKEANKSPIELAKDKLEYEFSPDQPKDTVTTSIANYLAARKPRKQTKRFI